MTQFLFIYAGIQPGQLTPADFPVMTTPPGHPLAAWVTSEVGRVLARVAASEATLLAAIARCKSLFSLHFILWPMQ